jgi:hypothetical protein
MRYRLAAAAAVLLLTGCTTAPVAPAPAAGAPGRAAPAVAGGVEVVAGAEAWRGWPSDLARFVTPIHVSLVNRGAAPVRVSHDDFALIVAGGRRRAVVLPYEVRGVVYQPPPPPLPSAGFSLEAVEPAGTHDWVLRGPAVPAEADPARVGEQFALPSPDVLDRALREGVVEPGGTASGFVYFDRLGARAAGPVELSARLVDARTGQLLGRLLIPIALP